MSKEAKSSETDFDEYQWIVEFRVRPPDERKRCGRHTLPVTAGV